MIKEVNGNTRKTDIAKPYNKNCNKINKNIENTTKNANLKNGKAITLIALVITVVVLLILARSKYSNINRREWIIDKSTRSKK